MLDEAPKVISYSPLLRRYLNRTKTQSRLALTSLPLAGNLIPYWFLLDWAVPELLGPQQEFWQVYVKKIRSETPFEAQLFALHLYRILQHVVFNIDAKTRNEMLEEKGYRLREETVNVKLSRKHSLVYKRTASFLANSVRRNHISLYVAMHILLLASTSVPMLKSALLRGVDDKDDIFGVHGERARRSMKKLHEEILPLCSSEEEIQSSKLELVVKLAYNRFRSGERIVIFGSVPEVQSTLRQQFRDKLRSEELTNVYYFESSADCTERENQVLSFNRSRNGAVLLVPFGPSLECVEDSAWSRIKAAQVLVVGTNWNCSTAAQVVERVISFDKPNHGNIQDIEVLYLISANTVESSIQKHISKLYVDLQNRAVATGTPMTTNPLLVPKIPVSMIGVNEDVSSTPMDLDSSRETGKPSGSLGRLFCQLQNSMETVKFESCPRWYELVSSIFDSIASYPFNMDERAARAVKREQHYYFENLSKVEQDLKEKMRSGGNYTRWQDMPVLDMRKTFCAFLLEMRKQGTILQYWHSYFLTYEEEKEEGNNNSRKRGISDRPSQGPTRQTRRRLT